MRVLLSAYACEPNKGSEAGVGWHWALEIARLGHEVWALTRANNRAPIEAAKVFVIGLEQAAHLLPDVLGKHGLVLGPSEDPGASGVMGEGRL